MMIIITIIIIIIINAEKDNEEEEEEKRLTKRNISTSRKSNLCALKQFLFIQKQDGNK